MGLFHFIKRTFECTFIHFYSKPTKSLNKIIREMGYYWLFFGIVIPFYLFHPQYQDKLLVSTIVPEYYLEYVYYILAVFFLFCEVMNFLCHNHLKSFRKRDHDFTRGIPYYHGFSASSCANYFWEILAWTTFALVTQTLISFVFLFISFFRMNSRAHKKHYRYIAEFKNFYPAEERCYFIPYLFWYWKFRFYMKPRKHAHKMNQY